MDSFDRYSQFRNGKEIEIVSFGEIPVKDSDKYIIYEKGKTRLDQVSYKYYNSSNYAWLILQANAKYGSLEFNIPDGVQLRIPYPLTVSLNDYQKSIEKNKKYYG
jgi:hypothetical protein